MRRGSALAFLFLVVFALAIIIRLPLGPLLRFLPPGIHCEDPEGSPWSGHCASLRLEQSGRSMGIGALDWSLKPWRLFRARLAFDVRVHAAEAGRSADQLTAIVQITTSRQLEVLGLSGTLPLQTFAGSLPQGWTGQLQFKDLRLRLRADGRILAADGEVSVRQLRSPRPYDWGSHVLRMPRASGEGLAPGSVQSLEGPLQVDGTLQLQPDGGWQLDARVGAKDPALADELSASLAVLGPPDAAGLRPLSVAGRF